MKRKKKRMSTLVRVLLCSWCVLGLVLAFFIVDWAMDLSKKDKQGDGSKDAFLQVTGEPGVTQAVTRPGDSEVTLEPTATPMPQAEFVTEYPHTGESLERYGYSGNVVYALRSPRREDAAQEGAAEQVVQELLTEKLTEFSGDMKRTYTLLVDYEDGETAGLYSVLFYIETEADGVKETEMKQLLFNKKKGEPVAEPQRLFADRAYAYVAQQVNLLLAEEEGPFSGTREEFPEYVLTAEGAKFYYEVEGVQQSITIPYIALHTYMAVTENGTVIADTIRDLDPDKPMIALTFDDGPHYQQTPRLLELLDQYGVKSTFFILGDRSHFSESNKKTVKMVADAGHEIASHTYSHKNLKTLTLEQLTEEVVRARENLYALTGEYPTFIRPPYGAYNDLVKEHCYAPLIIWNLDSLDWNYRNTEQVVDHVLAEAGDGKIVLMHDIHWFTVDAVEILLPELEKRGYQVVTVRELFYYKNVELKNGGIYHSSYN